MIFDIYGYQIEETNVYIVIGIVIAILFTIIIIMSMRAKSSIRIKSKEDLYAQFAQLGETKAQLKAKLSAIEETKNYGQMAQKEYESQVSKTSRQIAEIDERMDDILNTLALPHYSVKLQQEKGLEAEKMNLLVNLQKESNAQKSRISELEATLSDIKERNKILDAENEDLGNKLVNIESTHKDKVMHLEAELDAARKKRRQ